MKKLQLSFSSRIAYYYIGITALIIAVLFALLYFIVSDTVYTHLNEDLEAERNEVYTGIVVLNNSIVFTNPYEWSEKEHGQIEVNPTFIMVTDASGKELKKTPNLRYSLLKFDKNIKEKSYFNSTFSGSPVRQLQTAIRNPGGKILGYMIIAIPLEESAIVLKNLRYTLMIGLPVVILILFVLSRSIAGNFISPLNKVIRKAEKITKENLKERIEVPAQMDEIASLTITINELLDRLEDVIIREKQFTADASHELRTPLSIIKGTLEVLLRKPRDTQQYVEKINYVINEVDRMSLLIEKLLQLARLESGKLKPDIHEFDLSSVIQTIKERFSQNITEKKIIFDECNEHIVKADAAMTSQILENIISNALKYSDDKSSVEISISKEAEHIVCSIKDIGRGIPAEQLHRIFDRFYRLDESRNFQIEGAGLGLSIVKRLADLQKLKITVDSKPGIGTTFFIYFPSF